MTMNMMYCCSLLTLMISSVTQIAAESGAATSTPSGGASASHDAPAANVK
jgi:hypothetical protein